MPLLRGSDSCALLALAGDVAECETAAQLEAQIAVGLPRVIGADAAMVTACRDWGDEVELEVGDRDVYCAELLAAIGTRWREHPVLTRDLARANSAPRRLSDFVPGRDWRRRGLFNDFYRPLGLTRELAVQLSWGPVGSSCCAALHRDGSDFSERDRLALALVAPHLRAARARIAARVSLDRRLALLEHGIEDMRGALVVGSGGHLIVAGPHARDLLKRWFDTGAHALPGDLADWWSSARAQSAAPVFEVAAGERRLRARLVRGADEDLLILTEPGNSLP